jgi:hypothetical protein
MRERSIGPYVVDGHLFFQMLDGSSISCECIGEPYALQIVAMWFWHHDDEPYVPNENTVRLSIEDWRKLNQGINPLDHEQTK